MGACQTKLMRRPLQMRNDQLRAAIDALSLSQPYDNARPIRIPARCDQQPLLAALIEMFPHVGCEQWMAWFQNGDIRDGDQPAAVDTIVRAGKQLWHRFPDWIDPAVNTDITVLWEDASIIVVDKPAPLPVHPCGRYNRNTLTSLLGMVYAAEDLRLVHRLDANTSGVILFARSAAVATSLRYQFERQSIEKRYLVACHGSPASDRFYCAQPISKRPGAGGVRTIDPNGLPAVTEFEVLQRCGETTSWLTARPRTGRTNQIRIHLWGLGMPVCGDPAYLPGQRIGRQQTLSISDPPMGLHAAELGFHHPCTNRPVVARSCLPANWTLGSGTSPQGQNPVSTDC